MPRTEGTETPRDVKQLAVWQKSIDPCKAVYRATQGFPSAERFGLTAQMRRAAVAIPSNLAEGRGRGSRPDYRQFVVIARGSSCELETQLIIAHELGFLKAGEAEGLLKQTREIIRMLHGLVRSLSPQ